ncbi:MAG: hypothetical protein ACFFDS_02105 [Candidatus Thorarchaeota archaeon]
MKIKKLAVIAFISLLLILMIIFLILGFALEDDILKTVGIALIPISITELARFLYTTYEENKKLKDEKKDRLIELETHVREFVFYFKRPEINFPLHVTFSNLRTLISKNVIQYKKDLTKDLFPLLENIMVDSYKKNIPQRYGAEQRKDPFVTNLVDEFEKFADKLEAEIKEL